MGKARLDPMRAVRFECSSCGNKWTGEPDAVEPAPERYWHPWSYVARCSECQCEAGQIWYEQNLLRAWAEASGPQTEEGLRRCKFNAMRHGLASKVATYYPAKPGKYPHCSTCEYLAAEDCRDFGGCLKRTELVLKHQLAFESRNPEVLTALQANTQAHIQALIDDMILAILQDGGPRTKTPEWYYDKEGDFHLAEYLDEESGRLIRLEKLEAHPLLRPLIDYLAKNRMTLEDMGMTAKVQEDQRLISGQLDDHEKDRETVREFQRRQSEQQRRLLELIGQGGDERAALVLEGNSADGD